LSVSVGQTNLPVPWDIFFSITTLYNSIVEGLNYRSNRFHDSDEGSNAKLIERENNCLHCTNKRSESFYDIFLAPSVKLTEEYRELLDERQKKKEEKVNTNIYVQYTLVKWDAQGPRKIVLLSEVFLLKRKFTRPGKSVSLSKVPLIRRPSYREYTV